MPIPPARLPRSILAALCLAALLPAVTLRPAGAVSDEVRAGPLVIVHPWSRATPAGAAAGAGYVVIRNTGDVPDRLVSITSPAADRVTAHSMTMMDGVMRMRPYAAGVPIPAHGEVTFRPGADHLMFEGLKRAFAKGESVAATLVFEKAGAVGVAFKVGAAGAKAPDGNHGDMKDMKM